MVEVNGEWKKIRETIASFVSNMETMGTIPTVCEKLGLPPLEWDEDGSKYKWVFRMVSEADNPTIIMVAKQMLTAYPGSRGKPNDEDRQIIQDAIWWIESEGHQQISNVVRFEIAEKLDENFTFWGRSAGLEDFFSSAKIYIKDYAGVVAGEYGYLYQDPSKITNLWDPFSIFGSPTSKQKKSLTPHHKESRF